MRIQPLNNQYYINQYNKKNNNKYASTPINNNNNNIAELSAVHNQQINFAGFFGIFSSDKKENISLDENTGILSEKQIKRAKKLVNSEIYNIMFENEYSEATSKRLDQLLHSPFVDYNLEGLDPERSYISLNDLIITRKSENNNKLYNQFLITSLAETLPELTFINKTNEELTSNEYTIKQGFQKIYHNNNAIFQIFQSYLKTDEDSKEAEAIRKMIKTLKDYNMETKDYPSFFAECLLNNKIKMCKFLCDEIGLEPLTNVPAVRNSRGRDNISVYKDKKGISAVYKDKEYYENELYPNFAIIYPDKAYDTYISSDDRTGYKLYDISALSQGKDAKEFFDIPDYLYRSFKGETSFKYLTQDTDMWGYPNGVFRSEHFFWDNRDRHPEILTIDFLEKFASKFTQDELHANMYVNAINWRLWNRNDNLKNVLSLIKQLQNDNSPETQKRIDLLKYIYKRIGICADIHPKTLEDNLAKIKYLDVEDLTNNNDISSKELNRKMHKNLNNYVCDKYDIYDINSWNDILDELNEVANSNTDKNIITEFVLNNLPDIFYTEENRDSYEKVIENLRNIDGDWNITDAFGNNLAYKAVEAENPLLINFAKEKKVDFSRKNNAGQNAIELINSNCCNPVVNTVKINSNELINYVKKGILSGVEIILSNPAIDVNSVDENGDSTGIIASSRGNVNIIRFLNKRDDFDINYINPKTLQSAYTSAKNNETLKAVMDNSNFDISKSDLSDYSKLFSLLENPNNPVDDIEKVLIELSNNKNFNLEIVYNGKSLQERIKEYAFQKDVHKQEQIHDRLYSNLEQSINNSFLNKARCIIEENGLLTLAQIEDIINYPNAERIINKPLNEFNEPIGFFVADIPVTGSSISSLTDIIDKLKKLNYDFSVKNKTGQTLLDKTIDSENIFLKEYLQSIGVNK